MNTTDLFVEILVIGVGALIWITLLILGIFGYPVMVEQLLSIPALLPISALVYVLGIITDRIADVIFDRLFVNSIRKKFYPDVKQDFNDRRIILVYSEPLSRLLEYGRSRLRIVRGWTLNFLLILITFNVFVQARVTDNLLRANLLTFGNILLALLTFLSFYSWNSFVRTEFRKVKEQAAFLKAMGFVKANKETQQAK